MALISRHYAIRKFWLHYDKNHILLYYVFLTLFIRLSQMNKLVYISGLSLLVLEGIKVNIS